MDAPLSMGTTVTERMPTKPEAMRDDEARAARVAKLRRRFPTVEELRRRARWRVPHFAFDFVDGGAGIAALPQL